MLLRRFSTRASIVEGVSGLLTQAAAFAESMQGEGAACPRAELHAQLRGLYAQHFLFLESVASYSYFSNAAVDNAKLEEYRVKLERNQREMDRLLPELRVRPSLLRAGLQLAGVKWGVAGALWGEQLNLAIKAGFERALLDRVTGVLRAVYAMEDAKLEGGELVAWLKKLREEMEEAAGGEGGAKVEGGLVAQTAEEGFGVLGGVAGRL